ncbi:MAG: PH domain-containing protein, partial [Candidatus Micrarchaeota archaeon]|nr:PH domain-containing protein [Candidatus Micrarchaeota archaeon]
SDVHKMHVDQREVGEVRKFLGPEEVVEMTVRQRKLRPGGSLITPTSFIATNRRLMIINRTRFGIRKDYEVILYRNITAVKLAHGLFSCSVLIRVSNADTSDGQGQQEAIGGIRPREAEALTHYLNKKIINAHQADRQDAPSKQDSPQADSKFCIQCGSKNSVLAKFCAACGAAAGVEA